MSLSTIRPFLLGSMLTLFACSSPSEEAPSATAAKTGGAAAPPKAVQQALEGPARPALLLTQAWFWKDADGKSRPGPARLEIWRESDRGWEATRLEDGDSNVFHKAIPFDGGILTIGAERALLKKWTHSGGTWSSETLWEREWGGRFNRLRDMEIGDVDGDGHDEIVVATHDAGVVAVIDIEGGTPKVTEFDEKVDTFVHEIEIGDIDGDGKLEFFATPSDRNKADASQAGGIVMYRWNGSTYERSWIEEQHGTHAKEILAHDMDGDGKAELFGVLEAQIDPANKTRLLKPVEIRQYMVAADGSVTHKTIATIEDRLTRFLVPADFDGDGQSELVAASFRTGLHHVRPPAEPGGAWTTKLFDRNSSGFEHAAYATDLDNDGSPELYVAADDQGKLRRYVYGTGGVFRKTELGVLDKSVLTWNITTGTF